MRNHLLVLFSLLVSTSVTAAQPIVVHSDGRVTATVPLEIQLRSGGVHEIKTGTIGPFPFEELQANLPRRVPIFSIDPAGGRTAGFVIANETAEAAPNIVKSRPNRLFYSADAGYTVDWVAVATTGGRDRFSPGDSMLMTSSWASVPVQYAAARSTGVVHRPRANPFTVVWNSVTGVPNGRQNQVDQVLANVKARLEQFLGASRGNVSVDINFVANPPGISIARTTVTLAVPTFPNMRSFLTQQAFLDGFDRDENDDITSYESFPAGNTFPAITNFPAITSLGHVQMTTSLWDQLFIPSLRPRPFSKTLVLQTG